MSEPRLRGVDFVRHVGCRTAVCRHHNTVTAAGYQRKFAVLWQKKSTKTIYVAHELPEGLPGITGTWMDSSSSSRIVTPVAIS
jgi:hypothetical protein